MNLQAMEKIKLAGVKCPRCGKVDTITLYYTYSGDKVFICNNCGDVTQEFAKAREEMVEEENQEEE